MLNRFSFLSILGMLSIVTLPNPVLADISLGIATDTHTHPSTTELKPTSFIDLSKSYKVASVCFLGVGDCPQGGFDKGDEDYSVDTAKQCMNEGYIKNNCNSAQEPDTLCPYNSSYVKGCKCKSSLISCSSPKIGVGPSCSGKYASCTCPSSVSLTNPNDRCTQYCDGSCITKTCSPNASESGCSYGTQSCSNGCGGTRSCCKPCYPYSDESGCSYGTYSCSNGCGGTRRCCASCSPSGNETGCRYGTYTCSNGCGGTRTCCSSCTPLSNETGCQYGTESCSNGCGGTRTCCKGNPCNSVTAVSVPSNAYCSSYHSNCSSKCAAWNCNSGYKKSGNSCVAADPCAGVTGVTCSRGYRCSSTYCGKCSSCTKCDSSYNLTSCTIGVDAAGSTEPGTCSECGGMYKKTCFSPDGYMSGGTCVYDCRDFDSCMSRTGNNCNSCRTYSNAPVCEHPYSSCY